MPDVTFTQATTRVQTLLGTDASLSTTEIQSMMQTRYESLYETMPWSKRLRDFTINLYAQTSSTSANTVTVTNASSTVTSAGTPFVSADTGRQISIGDDPQYWFVSRDSSSVITLKDGNSVTVTWPGDTDTAAAWRLFQTYYNLPSNADDVMSLAGQYPMEEFDGGREALDAIDPYRISTADYPTHWVWAGTDPTTGYRRLEIWPVPTQARVLRGQMYLQAPTLSGSTVLDIPAPLLIWSTVADCCQMLHAKQGSAETMWENKALFFERKANEVASEYGFVDFQRLSPNRTISRRKGLRGLGGTDFGVTHQTELLR